jgi:hypothetical protein
MRVREYAILQLEAIDLLCVRVDLYEDCFAFRTYTDGLTPRFLASISGFAVTAAYDFGYVLLTRRKSAPKWKACPIVLGKRGWWDFAIGAIPARIWETGFLEGGFCLLSIGHHRWLS